MYCQYCGKEISSDMAYCPGCGSPLTAVSTKTTVVSSSANGGIYRLILVSSGSSTRSVTIDLISDLLGYTESMAGELYDAAPVEIAEGLTEVQAKCLAQAFTEYGIEVSVSDGNGIVNLTSSSNSSLFSNDGSMLAGAAAIIATLSTLNRVTSFRRHPKPSLLERLFHLNFRPAQPPRHVRRQFFEPRYERPIGRSMHTPAPHRPARQSSAHSEPRRNDQMAFGKGGQRGPGGRGHR